MGRIKIKEKLKELRTFINAGLDVHRVIGESLSVQLCLPVFLYAGIQITDTMGC